MGLFNLTKAQYYQGNNGLNDFGEYQFISLHDIITQFEIAYVGENKIIPNIKRTDIGFFAQRALQELSFDTFKSIKAQEIIIPPTLQMLLPHDYVNYTKISYVDGAGIKRPLYSTKHTSNPTAIKQLENGDYDFGSEVSLGTNMSWEDNTLNGWSTTAAGASKSWSSINLTANNLNFPNYNADIVDVVVESLRFGQLVNTFGGDTGSRGYAAWQAIDVSLSSYIDIKATAISGAQKFGDGVNHPLTDLICDFGVIRVGITTTDPSIGWPDSNGNLQPATNSSMNPANQSPNFHESCFDKGFMEWNDGTTSEKEILGIDVEGINTIYVLIQSFSPFTNKAFTPFLTGTIGSSTPITPTASYYNDHQFNIVDNIEILAPGQLPDFQPVNSEGTSSTWQKYKSTTPSENNNDDYEDDVYWPIDGKRYGLEPSIAQINGSFYIDELAGKIHFSSNINGKTVILDYISDSMGTDEEMKVHKLAEDAMYKWIAHAIISTSSYGQSLVPRLTKEKFAAVRKAKLRLSNIKIEDLTQILRGKSKQIKH